MAQIRTTQKTAQELIETSLRIITVLREDREASTYRLANSLDVLNDMIEAWNLQRLIIYQITRESFALTPSKNPHTIGLSVAGGPAGDLGVVRPPRIDSASVLVQNSEYPMRIMSRDEYQGIPEKTITTTFPTELWYERDWPLGKIWLYPVSSESVELILYLWRQLDSGMALGDRFNVPPGYLRALKYNLAVELASEFGRTPRPDVSRIARQSKALLGNLNTSSERRYMRPDPTVPGVSRGRYNIHSGGYYR